jgi:hypothetical protein
VIFINYWYDTDAGRKSNKERLIWETRHQINHLKRSKNLKKNQPRSLQSKKPLLKNRKSKQRTDIKPESKLKRPTFGYPKVGFSEQPKGGPCVPLYGEMVEAHSLNVNEKDAMYELMQTYYDGMVHDAFLRDLHEKDCCVLLRDASGCLRGFSTQKLVRLEMDGKTVHGVFSGDTIIRKEDWGSLELFRVFTRHFLQTGRQYKEFYWFLISKGYKTYKILPLFFNEFYPRCQAETPAYEKALIDAFGSGRYPGEYDQASGVIVYRKQKDKLKQGVADIGEKHLRDEHITFFLQANPGYDRGNDLVCLARLDELNLNRAAHRLLLGRR